MSVKFVSFSTFIDPSFWNEINSKKLNEWKLDDSLKTIVGSFVLQGKQLFDCPFYLHHDAFTNQSSLSEQYRIGGKFHLTNTFNDFIQIDRKQILKLASKTLWKSITNDAWLKNPESLGCFYLTAYADLKHFVYHFWNCFPTLLYPSSIEIRSETQTCNESHVSMLRECMDFANTHNLTTFLLIDNVPTKVDVLSDKSLSVDRIVLVVLNPSAIPLQPAQNLRNLLAAVAYYRKDFNHIKVLCLRKDGVSSSFILDIQWTQPDESTFDDGVPKSVGWERNRHGQLTHSSIDLKSTFDPIKIMDQSMELNLKLIRWRLVPSIDLQRLSDLRVLMLGSGTLGCNLARALLGWGIKNFYFIDSANVNFNNPARQSLFQFEDCLSGSKSKAATASEALRKIYPSVNSAHMDMKIPMPGHPISSKEVPQVKELVRKLDELIRTHDVIFLVMDSRESRWLPTLLAAVHNKLAITVALGFDSFVVMRHGVCSEMESRSYDQASTSKETSFDPMRLVPAESLGCYYCSDVTAPGNSLSDRTLDQQCTITRAGLSMIASGMAAEMLTSVLQHELGPAAPARLADVDENSSVLGATPHQIRGFLSRFSLMTPTVRRFEKCTACGDVVKNRYKQDGFEFLHKVFEDPIELEKITGLAELHATATDLQMDVFEYDDSESITSSV